MKIKININKTHVIIFLFLIVLFGIYLVVAQQWITPNPGHSADEISGVCETDGAGCPGIPPLEVVYLHSGTYYCGLGNAFLCKVHQPPSFFTWTTNFNWNPSNNEYEDIFSRPCLDVLCS
jgi:hypothetical protein